MSVDSERILTKSEIEDIIRELEEEQGFNVDWLELSYTISDGLSWIILLTSVLLFMLPLGFLAFQLLVFTILLMIFIREIRLTKKDIKELAFHIEMLKLGAKSAEERE